MSPRRYRTILSPDAVSEIVEQADYYKLKSGSALANRWRVAVRDAAQSLKTMPERHSLVRFTSSRTRDIRRLQIDGFPNHSFYYRIDDATSTVHIIHMLHGSREFEWRFPLSPPPM